LTLATVATDDLAAPCTARDPRARRRHYVLPRPGRGRDVARRRVQAGPRRLRGAHRTPARSPRLRVRHDRRPAGPEPASLRDHPLGRRHEHRGERRPVTVADDPAL